MNIEKNVTNAKDVEFELIDIDDYFCIFTKKRLNKKSISSNAYMYELKKNPKNRVCEIQNYVESDKTFAGTIISRIPIYFKNGNCRHVRSCEFFGLKTSLIGYINIDKHQ